MCPLCPIVLIRVRIRRARRVRARLITSNISFSFFVKIFGHIGHKACKNADIRLFDCVSNIGHRQTHRTQSK